MQITTPEEHLGVSHAEQYGFEVPPNILPDLILQSGVNHDHHYRKIGGVPLLFATFEMGQRVPERVAEAAHYLSNVDGTMVLQVEGDRAIRFADLDDIQEHFLDIRRWTVVGDIRNGNMVASAWEHDVQGGKPDVDLLDASIAGGKGPKVVTHAFRVYHGYRHMGIGRELVDIKLKEDFLARLGCRGSIIRVSSSRQTAGFFERYTPYSHLDLPKKFLRDDGVNIMFAPNPPIVDDEPGQTEPTLV